jgi:NADPH-dependent curcumin reductase CurA
MPRQIILASRPSGWPTADTFALTEADRPDLADGQVRVRNLFMSVDPYMRGRMNDVKSYVPPFRLGEPLEGGAIGTVIESRSPDLAEGDVVLHMLGWRDEAVLPARHARKVTPAEGLSPSAYLGVLGMPTLTAYVGVLDIAALKPGETVFVSGAAGAVGSMAGQDRLPDMVADVSAWLREGKIAHAETIVDGLDRAPGAFIDLLRGANTGKMLVRL